MVTKREGVTLYDSAPETTFGVDDMREGTLEALDKIFSTMISRRDLKPVTTDGASSFTGLQERIDVKIGEANLPKCDPVSCSLHVELVGAEHGEAARCALRLTCKPVSSEDEAEATTYEETCRGTQERTVDAFEGWVSATHDDISKLTLESSKARAALETHERLLSGLV